jgi:hypothetical protein
VGLIEQAEVPGGILNITTDLHGVYKGTIRRTVFEYQGKHLRPYRRRRHQQVHELA